MIVEYTKLRCQVNVLPIIGIAWQDFPTAWYKLGAWKYAVHFSWIVWTVSFYF